MRRPVATAMLIAALAAGCSSGQDGTDFTGRSAGDAPGTAATPAEGGRPTPTGPKTWAMGYRSTIFDDKKTNVLRLTVAAPKTLPTDPYIKPQNGRFLAVTVTYEALQPTQDINPFDLVAITKSGERLQPTVGPESAGNQLQYATLNTGEKAKGSVVFDVPKTGVVGIAYAPVGQVLGTWKL